jgi:hypothetical protein
VVKVEYTFANEHEEFEYRAAKDRKVRFFVAHEL